MPVLIRSAATDSDIARCFAVMRQLRPHLVEHEFVARIRRMQPEGFHLALLDEEGVVRAVAGYRFYEKLFSGKNLYVDDLVTDEAMRSRGLGKALLDWLRNEARSLGCAQLHLDSGLQRPDAHRFYERESLKKTAFHFAVKVSD